jgi:hypothetical protein
MHSDFITFRRLENLNVTIPMIEQSHFLGVRVGDHYMLLQRFTMGVYLALLHFPLTSGPTCSAKVSPDLKPLLHHADPSHVLCPSPCNRARLTTYGIPN